MDKRTIWYDPDEWPDASGTLIHGGLARDAGTELCFIRTEARDEETVRQLAGKGFSLLQEGENVTLTWYSLPRLYVFARGDGGFYAADRPVGLNSPDTVWHVDGSRHVTRAADSVPSLIRAILAGEAPLRTADDTHRLFSSWREAEAAGELFLRNDTPWKRGKRRTMN